jgi:hypothetical protein
VLELTSELTCSRMIETSNDLDKNCLLITVYALLFLRTLVYAVNSKECETIDRIRMLWATLLFFDCLDGISAITKRNLVFCILPQIFLLIDERTKVLRYLLAYIFKVRDHLQIRYTTSEPAEHFFGQARSFRHGLREFTIKDFLEISRSLNGQLNLLYK